jgi:multimeric flavodoxin WrbA
VDITKVVVALGSPRRKGNSAILAQRLMEGVESAGGACESFFLQGMSINPCTACDECLKSMDRYCVIEDDMEGLYPKIRKADSLVFASPVYWFSISAQTKLFMDRLYAFQGPEGNGLSGKPVGIVLTYGDTDPFTSGAVNALRTFQDAFGYIGSPIVGKVYGSAMDAGEILEKKELLQEAYELGKRLVSAAQ